MIVADTTALIALHTPGVPQPDARAALGRDDDWRVTPHWRSEFGNALLKLVRGRMISDAQAEEAIADAVATLTGRERSVPVLSIYRLARDSGCSSYDAEIVTLAQALGVRLLTHDKRLLRLFPGIALTPGDFARLPPGA